MRFEKSRWGKEIPYKSPVTGRETKLYNIATVAEYLGRTSQTIRKWEIGGVIPKTPFSINGQRLYSTEHIDAIIRCAEKAHLKQGSRVSKTYFSRYVYEEFARVNELFFKEDLDGTQKES